MNNIILLTPDQVDRALRADDPTSVMGAEAVVWWTIKNRPENTKDMIIVTSAYKHTHYADKGRAVECRKIGPLLKGNVDRVVFVSVCADGVSPNVILHGWSTPLDVMRLGQVVTINGIRHYQLASFQLKPMEEFFPRKDNYDV